MNNIICDYIIDVITHCRKEHPEYYERKELKIKKE